MAGLYVHVPFRETERPYDDAYSVSPSPSRISVYATALESEIDRTLRDPERGHAIESVYLGGGRPGLVPTDVLCEILERIARATGSDSLHEVTIELAPPDVSPERLEQLTQAGVSRVNLESGSFVESGLIALGMPHSTSDNTDAIRTLARSSLRSYSCDLFFGFEARSLSNWKESLHRAVDAQIPHVTIHELEAGRGADDTSAREDALAYAMTYLPAKGLRQYELTHFARPGHASRHQQNYYGHGSYVGLGPSADSFWWNRVAPSPSARRWSNVADLDAYARRLDRHRLPRTDARSLDAPTLGREYIILALRTDRGIDLNVLQSRYGIDLRSACPNRIDRLEREGLVELAEPCLHLTDAGRLVTDAIIRQLLPT